MDVKIFRKIQIRQKARHVADIFFTRFRADEDISTSTEALTEINP